RLAGLARSRPALSGIVHLGSLDIRLEGGMEDGDLAAQARLGCTSVCNLLQAISVTDGLTVGSLWTVTRAAQHVAGSAARLNIGQSPVWGFARGAITEHPQLPCRLVDLATGSDTEIAALAAELEGEGSGEDEIALHGELRYVRRLEPVSLNTLSGMGPGQASDARAFRFEIGQRGILDSLSARP